MSESIHEIVTEGTHEVAEELTDTDMELIGAKVVDSNEPSLPEVATISEEHTIPSELQSVDGFTPGGSPTVGGNAGIKSVLPGINEDFSRAGRKRKANSRYLEEPSPVSKPVARKSSGKKSAPVVMSPKSGPKKSAPGDKSKTDSVKSEPVPTDPVVTGPPTFGSMLFGKSARKLSDSISESAFLDEEIPDEISEDLELPFPVVLEHNHEDLKEVDADLGAEKSEPTAASGHPPYEPHKLEGNYIASGAAGPTVHPAVKTALVPPSNEGSIIFPDLTTEEYVASSSSSGYVPVMAELAGGGLLSLLPSAPVPWLRDEIPKLSAYFRKKMESGAGTAPKVLATSVAPPAPGEPKKPTLTEAQRDERRREREEERRRLIEERNRRKERERLKQLYRQHWLALTKFPIEDDLLHSHKGVRRLGHAPIQCRQIAPPAVFWDCRLGPPGTLKVPMNLSAKSTELLDEMLVVWNFFNQFGPHLLGKKNPEFTMPQLVEGIFRRDLTALVSQVYGSLVELLRPWIEYQVSVLLHAEQALESQLTKNRGRAKLYWSSICQFRDFLFLGYSVLVNQVAAPSAQDADTFVGAGSTNWLWLSLYIAKSIVLFESIEQRTKEFLNTISTAFEEIDFEHKWIFEWELNGLDYASMPLRNRVKLLKLMVDKIVSLPVIKKIVDLGCDARAHISAEIAYIEKEERKLGQRISLCQKLQSILDTAPEGVDTASIQLPMTSDEMTREMGQRETMVKARKIGSAYSDAQLSSRLEMIGRDRHMNEYFQVSTCRRIVFVRQHSVSHPNVVRYGVYDSLSNVESLIQSLDERGVREAGLKAELQKIKANIYSDMMARGENDFEETYIDWTGSSRVRIECSTDTFLTQDDVDNCTQIKFLNDCMQLSRDGLDRIRDAWFGKGVRSATIEDEDDITVDEEEMMDDESMDDEQDDLSVSSLVVRQPFCNERESLYGSILLLSNTLTSGFKEAFLGFSKVGESASASSSVLVQFHIKSGSDLLRHVSIPTDVNEFTRLLNSVKESSISSVTAVILDGLLALDEVIHDEIQRHGPDSGIEIWHPTGGERHAWKSFLGIDQAAAPSPGEEETESPEDDTPEEKPMTPGRSGSAHSQFSCEGCEKTFKYHILLGVHKLHPCKTRGRKPLPVDPVMEVRPLSESNGVLCIDKVTLPDFPQLPSTRQEAIEKAEKAAAAAQATAAAPPADGAVAPGVTAGEFICDICGKGFPHNQGLAVHQTRWCIPEQQAQLILTAQQAVGGMPAPASTEPQGSVTCDNCGKVFPTSQGLAIHQTRWCKVSEKAEVKGPGGEVKTPKILHTDPQFVKDAVSPDELIKIEESEDSMSVVDEDTSRQPGYTPACFSLAAVSVAVLWYNTRIDKAIEKFTSGKVHHGRGAVSKKSGKK